MTESRELLPSAYYAHQPERDMGQEIAEDLLTSPADLVIAAPVEALQQTIVC